VRVRRVQRKKSEECIVAVRQCALLFSFISALPVSSSLSSFFKCERKRVVFVVKRQHVSDILCAPLFLVEIEGRGRIGRGEARQQAEVKAGKKRGCKEKRPADSRRGRRQACRQHERGKRRQRRGKSKSAKMPIPEANALHLIGVLVERCREVVGGALSFFSSPPSVCALCACVKGVRCKRAEVPLLFLHSFSFLLPPSFQV